MALINPNIALSFRPTTEYKPPNPVADFAQLQQIQTGMRQNELARSTQARLQREDVDRNALNAAYQAAYDPQTGNIDPAKLRAAMVTGGQGAQLPAIERNLAELEAKRLAQSKTKIEAAQAGETLIAGALRNLGADPSDSSIDAALADLGGSNLFTPDRMRSLTAFGDNLKRLPDNERRARLAQQGAPPAAPTSPEVRGKAEEDRIAQAARNLAPNPTDANIDSTVAMLMSTNAVSPDRRPGLLAFVDRLKAMPLAQRATVLLSQGAPARQTSLLTPDEEAQKMRLRPPGTTVNVSTDKAYGGAVAASAGKSDLAQVEAAAALPQQFAKVNETLQLLRTGDLNTGVGAELFTVLDRAKTQFANDKKAGQRVENTQYLDALLGSEVFPLIQQLGIGARGLDTIAEREYLRKVMTGTINLDRSTLLRLTELRRQALVNKAKEFNERVDSGELDALYKALPGRVKRKVDIPSEGGRPPGVGANWTLMRDQNGKEAWVSPDRKSFKETEK